MIVRSVTKVDSGLLDGTTVKFVGTATIGTDHIDIPYLENNNIGFSSAPGSNANSVAEYITAALLFLAKTKEFSLEQKTLGIIGVGNVGSCVEAKARALGMKVLLNDPPLSRETKDPKYLPLSEIFKANIITLHVPLTKEGQDPTFHMVNEGFINKMNKEAILINSARGSVVDETVLKSALEKKQIAAAVLDVWEHEPGIDTDLLNLVSLGTPHIAGYSFDGKVNGTFMIYQALCRYLGETPKWNTDKALSNQDLEPLVVKGNSEEQKKTEDIINDLVKQLYDVTKDDQQLRKIAELHTEGRGAYFDSLRKGYPVRREFQSRMVKVLEKHKDLAGMIQKLGFNRGERT